MAVWDTLKCCLDATISRLLVVVTDLYTHQTEYCNCKISYYLLLIVFFFCGFLGHDMG